MLAAWFLPPYPPQGKILGACILKSFSHGLSTFAGLVDMGCLVLVCPIAYFE